MSAVRIYAKKTGNRLSLKPHGRFLLERRLACYDFEFEPWLAVGMVPILQRQLVRFKHLGNLINHDLDLGMLDC